MYSNFKTESLFQGFLFFQCVFAPLSLKNESTLGNIIARTVYQSTFKKEKATCLISNCKARKDATLY